MGRAEGEAKRWTWERLLVHVTGDPKKFGADRDRRWMTFLIVAMVLGSFALVLVLIYRDLGPNPVDPQVVVSKPAHSPSPPPGSPAR